MLLIMLGGVGGIVVDWIRTPSDARRTRRALRGVPLVPIRDVVEGSATRIRGAAAPWQETVIAPLTGRRCMYFEVWIEQHPAAGTPWSPMAHETGGVPFIIDDGTGRAIIDPTAATVVVHSDHTAQSGFRTEPTPLHAAFAKKFSLDPIGSLFYKNLRFREAVIEAGTEVTVLGTGVREPDPDGARDASGYRDGGPTRLRISGNAHVPLYVSDRDSDG